MTMDIDKEALIRDLGTVIADELKPVMQELADLKQEFARLTFKVEHQDLRVREYRFAGVWSERAVYKQGNTVQHGGSTWHCNIDGISTVPGTDHTGWTLMAKRGADASGAR